MKFNEFMNLVHLDQLSRGITIVPESSYGKMYDGDERKFFIDEDIVTGRLPEAVWNAEVLMVEADHDELRIAVEL